MSPQIRKPKSSIGRPPGAAKRDPAPAALITGASRGIGRAIAITLAQHGFDCVVNYARNAAAATEVKKHIESAGQRAHLVKANIASSTDRTRLLNETINAFGRINLLVNNAGAAPDIRADLLQATEDSFDKMITTNLKGPYFLTQLVANQMIQQNKGSGFRVQASADAPSCLRASVPPCLPKIITITSISAYTPSVNRGDYCLAKAALAMMTKLYAARLAPHGISVFEIRPGIIETDMTGPVKAKYDKLILEDGITPIRRWGRPNDVARAVAAIATDAFPFSTAEVMNIDGGFHLRQL